MKQVFEFFYNKYREKILFLVLITYLTVGIARNSTLMFIRFFDIFSRILQVLCGVILAIYLFIDLITRKIRLNIFLITGAVCAAGTLIFAHTMSLSFLLAFIYVFKGCKFERIAKVYALTTFVVLIIINLLALTGCIENLARSRGELARVCLGFQWPTQPMTYFFFACLAYNYVCEKKIAYTMLLFELMISLLLFHLTNTRTSFVLMCILVLFSFFYKVLDTKKFESYLSKDKTNKVCSIVFGILPILSILFFGFLVILFGFDVGFATKINNLLSGRLRLTWNAFHEHSITLFGDTYNWTINGNYTGVDSAFYHYFFECGIFPTIFILFVTVCLYYQAFRQRKYWLCLILFLILCESVIDVFYWDIRYNIFLLILAEGSFCNRMIFGKKSAPQVDKNDTVKPQNENLKNSEGVAN